MKRILSLDGGGIRGVFSLEVLLAMQTLLREHYGKPDLVLADHFDFFSGTSTGAIIATCLCWGMSVERILDLYVDYGRTMFQPVAWYRPFRKMLVSRYEAKPLSDLLQRVFSEDGEGKIPALLGTERLKKLLLVVIRNHSSGSAWPVTNNALALFNCATANDCNLNIPLWKVVRASTAAPVYFDPEEITLGDQSHVFVDGSVTPYNNPALIAALTAVLPCYRVEWTPGPENLRVVSVGTMRFPSRLPPNMRRLWIGYNASRIPMALIQGIAWEQDFLCRCLGECIYGEPLDSEIGDLVGVPLPGDRWFGYVRYNRSFKEKELHDLLIKNPKLAQLDAVQSIPLLRTLGQSYARENVKLEHFV
jgi:hypothetical protein